MSKMSKAIMSVFEVDICTGTILNNYIVLLSAKMLWKKTVIGNGFVACRSVIL